MKKIGIVFHPMIEPAGKLARDLEAFVGGKQVEVWVCSAWDTEGVRTKLKGTDLLLTVGGDGTILRAAQAVNHTDVPIAGINLGKLGFMTELSIEEAREGITGMLEGRGWIDERAMLEAVVMLPDQKYSTVYFALNDVVAARGAFARVINVAATMNGEPLTTYKGDGVIVATATGSTGYALAAGGPILQPASDEMVLVPIMPHLSAAYPLVLPGDAQIGLTVQSVHPTTISIDGHINIVAGSGTVIQIKKSRQKLKFMRIHPGAYFYSALERRLKGKQ
ncbi:MAG: NAD(+)/NADH kinase [Dehalococcoidales bacterium]|nr:NAD(+)/NADH kinase [Dehalococcoidales bacterium]